MSAGPGSRVEAGREIELKRLLLGEGAADRLLHELGGVVRAVHRQRTHVLDTEDRRLAAADLALRLREEQASPAPPTVRLGAKGPGRALGPSTVVRAEVEAAVDGGVARALLRGEADPLQALRAAVADPHGDALLDRLAATAAGRSIRAIGAFENLRRVVPAALPGGLALVVELDRTRFPGGRVDDEVEIELADEADVSRVETWLAARARAAGVITAPAPPKLLRFLAALGGA